MSAQEIEFDASQVEALRRRVSPGVEQVGGIIGPPGAGKTTVLAREIADCITQLGERVLMCSGQNATVDQTLHFVNAILSERGWSPDVIKRTGNLAACSDTLVAQFGTRRNDILARARAVFTTFHSSFVETGDRILDPNGFDRLVFDETGQATPEQAWIPLILLKRNPHSKVSVYGDDQQLVPFSPDFVKEKGVLRYLRENKPSTAMQLNTSYRLPDRCVDMTGSIWYGGNLDAPRAIRARRLRLNGNPSGPLREILDPENTLVYVGVNSREEFSGQSWDNHGQARIVGQIVREFESLGVGPERILSMVPYRPHVRSTTAALQGTGVSCSTVHRRLGAENDIAIFATTRSNIDRKLGILAVGPELLNVATSRQRMKLIVVGDSNLTFSEGSRTTRRIYDFIESHGIIVNLAG
jgi:superfamily I DNA and/or RNA helicase